LGNDEIPQKDESTEPPSWRGIIANLASAYVNSRKANSEKPTGELRAANWTARATIAIAVLTAVTIVVGTAQYFVLKRADETTRESFSAVQRAFVTVTDVAIDSFHQKVMPPMEGDLFWRFTPMIENSGTTPTRNLRWTTSATNEGPITDFNKLGLDLEPLVKNNKNAWRFGILGPKAKMNLTYTANALELNESWIPLIADNKASFTWQGVIRYNDIFPETEEHVTKFCYVVRVYTARDAQAPYLQQCSGRKNCADRECQQPD
jgi:hypothetical protein